MLGPIIGLTTSIATIAATGLARGGAAVITGQGRRQAPVRRVIVRQNSKPAVDKLVAALEAERSLRLQLERENARLRERVSVAEEAFDFFMSERAA